MLVTVFCQRRDRSELTFSLEVDPDLDLKNFRALCELESEVPARESTGPSFLHTDSLCGLEKVVVNHHVIEMPSGQHPGMFHKWSGPRRPTCGSIQYPVYSMLTSCVEYGISN